MCRQVAHLVLIIEALVWVRYTVDRQFGHTPKILNAKEKSKRIIVTYFIYFFQMDI